MPWLERTPARLRMEFIVAYESEGYSFTELCALFDVSRECGYKWLRRFEKDGIDGLKDRSRAPKRCPHKVDDAVRNLLIEARRKHPTWGPKKLLPWLERRHDVELPSRSTASEILKREGLSDTRRRRRRLEHPGKPTTTAATPNALWAADFKGEFLLRDGNYCYPLTVTDQHSRYVLACKALSSTKQIPVQRAFERLFREYGLPDAIRTDNGVPFVTIALGRLSRLSVWWIKLGIRPELTQPSHPEQNGQHERMHRTLKAETTRPRHEIQKLSKGSSMSGAVSSTTIVHMSRLPCSRHRRSTFHRLGHFRRRSSIRLIQVTSKSVTSVATTAFDGTAPGSTSARR